MVRQLATYLFVVLAAVPAGAAPTVRTMYGDAMAKEEAVREALADRQAGETVLKAVRAAVSDYEALVRQYPNSSYSDNALWQAGRLSLDAFGRFGQPRDRETGVRLLRMLQTEYPSSKLARLVPAQVPDPAPPQTPVVRALQASAPKDPPPGPTAAAPTQFPAATIKSIRRVVMPDVVRIVVEIDKEAPFHEERISGPARIFVDFESTRTTPSLVDQTLRFEGDSDVVRQVRIGRHPNATRIVLDAAGVSSYSVYPLYSPYRLVIDCVRSAPAPTPRASASSAGSTTAQRPVPSTGATPDRRPVPSTPARTALVSRTIAAPVARQLPRVAPGGAAALRAAYADVTLPSHGVASVWERRLPSVSPLSAGNIADASNEGPLPSRALRHEWNRPFPSGVPLATALLAEANLPSVEPADDRSAGSTSDAATAPVAAAVPTKPGFSIARQLGLGVSRIVIDPGHGGHDPGAQGKDVTEAELVLNVAQRLQRMLEAVPGVEVILTRQTDEFVSLQERTAIANREGADLFLSIHVNASASSQARGIETYFLNFANTLTAAQVAARENAASGQAMGDLPDFVRAIALHNKLDESRDFAALVQRAMVERLRLSNKTLRNLGVKQAPFVVLIGASMPSVLAEVSFLTNPQEARLLKSDAYRERIAEALFTGIRKYQTSLTRVQTVAHH